jgi:glucose-6-phosphate dehydrogenase assembly protein OpcA
VAAVVSEPATEVAWDGHVANVGELSGALNALQPTGPGGDPLAVTTVLNLVVAADPERAAEAELIIESLADHQPSRAIIVARDPDGDGIDAHVEARAQLMGSTRTPSRVELVHLRLHGAAADGAASAVRALLRADLPVYVWWPDLPDPADPVFVELAQRADRLIVEAGRGDGALGIRRLDQAISDRGPAVTDLAWAALTPWRQLLNQLTTREHLEHMREGATVTIRHGAAEPTLGALLLAGWLHDTIGPTTTTLFASAPRGGDPSICEVRLADPSGRVVEIDRVMGRAAAAVVTHVPDGTTHDRMMPMPERSRAQLLAGELELQRRDRPFERAVRAARRLVGA